MARNLNADILNDALTETKGKFIYPPYCRVLLHSIDINGEYYQRLRREIKSQKYWEAEDLHCQWVVNLIVKDNVRAQHAEPSSIYTLDVPTKEELLRKLDKSDACSSHINHNRAQQLLGSSNQARIGVARQLCLQLIARITSTHARELYEQIRQRNPDLHYWTIENDHCFSICEYIDDWNRDRCNIGLQRDSIRGIPEQEDLLRHVRRREETRAPTNSHLVRTAPFVHLPVAPLRPYDISAIVSDDDTQEVGGKRQRRQPDTLTTAVRALARERRKPKHDTKLHTRGVRKATNGRRSSIRVHNRVTQGLRRDERSGNIMGSYRNMCKRRQAHSKSENCSN